MAPRPSRRPRRDRPDGVARTPSEILPERGCRRRRVGVSAAFAAIAFVPLLISTLEESPGDGPRTPSVSYATLMQEVPKTATQMVSEAKQRIENLTPDQVAAELDRGGILLVDLREGEERVQKGVIPGAVHAARGMLEFYADPTNDDHRPEFDPRRRTILYCAGGARSALAVVTLRQLGYTNVAHLEGGFTAWTVAGREVTRA